MSNIRSTAQVASWRRDDIRIAYGGEKSSALGTTEPSPPLCPITGLDAGRRANIETVEFSWILENNRPSLEGCHAIDAQLDKLYRIYAKPL